MDHRIYINPFTNNHYKYIQYANNQYRGMCTYKLGVDLFIAIIMVYG